MQHLNDLGVHLAMDNFGTGNASLANLRGLPIDEVKIGRAYVTPMLRDQSDLEIVRSTVELAHGLGLRIVAAGAEDEGTLTRLAMLGADLAQGFHLGKPMPPDALAEWLTDRSRRFENPPNGQRR